MSLTAERFVTTGFGRNKPSRNSQICYRKHISQFETFLESRDKITQTVTDQDILDYTELLCSKYKQNTVHAKVAAISSYFKWLKKEKALSHMPKIKLPKRDTIEHQKLNSSDLNAIIQNISGNTLLKKRDLAIFLLIVFCGLKTEEVVAIDVENVDFENAKITVKNEKRPFQAAFSAMKAYADAKLESCLCWNKCGLVHNAFFLSKSNRRLCGRSLRRQVMKYTDKSYNMRDFRHTYLQNSKAKQEVLVQ